MRPCLHTERLRRRQRLIEVVAGQHDFHRVAAEGAGLVDLLLRRGHRHEDGALHAEMPAGIGHPLRMVPGTGTDKPPLVRMGCKMLAQRREGPAQLVAAHGAKVFALQPDLGVKLLAQMIIPLQRCFRKQLAQGAGGSTGGVGELGHRAIKPAVGTKTRGARSKALPLTVGLPFSPKRARRAANGF